MSSSKRQRQLAREKYERQQARRAQASDRRRRNQRITAVAVVGVLVLGALAYTVIAVAGSRDAATVADAADTSTTAESNADEISDEQITAEASTDEPIEEPAVLNCGPAMEPRADTIRFDAPGDAAPADSITFTTTCGDIVIALDEGAPETVRSEVFLTEQGFYDGVACHRLTTAGIFVLQCGDPAGDGTGGPGYTVPDENLPAEGANNYPAGTVAMANAGPGTSGSQFFIVYEDTTLPAGYTIWGQVTEGLDIVQEIASVGTEDGGSDGRPRQPMVIEQGTVQRS